MLDTHLLSISWELLDYFQFQSAYSLRKIPSNFAVCSLSFFFFFVLKNKSKFMILFFFTYFHSLTLNR